MTRPQALDTSLDVEALQTERCRRMSPAEKLALVGDLAGAEVVTVARRTRRVEEVLGSAQVRRAVHRGGAGVGDTQVRWVEGRGIAQLGIGVDVPLAVGSPGQGEPIVVGEDVVIARSPPKGRVTTGVGRVTPPSAVHTNPSQEPTAASTTGDDGSSEPHDSPERPTSPTPDQDREEAVARDTRPGGNQRARGRGPNIPQNPPEALK